MEKQCWPEPIEAIIFDNDGVLLDTIPIYAEANSKVIGQPYPDDFQLTVNGLSEYEFAKAVTQGFGCNMTPEQFISRRMEYLKSLFPTVKPVHGVERLVKRFYDMDLPMAVATSANREAQTLKSQNCQEMFSLFRYIVCGDEVTRAKPSPEIFQTASKRIGEFDPAHVLVFEDSYVGIKAANAAGMPSVFLASGSEDVDAEMKKAGAKPTLVIKSFDDFTFNEFNFASVKK